MEVSSSHTHGTIQLSLYFEQLSKKSLGDVCVCVCFLIFSLFLCVFSVRFDKLIWLHRSYIGMCGCVCASL